MTIGVLDKKQSSAPGRWQNGLVQNRKTTKKEKRSRRTRRKRKRKQRRRRKNYSRQIE